MKVVYLVTDAKRFDSAFQSFNSLFLCAVAQLENKHSYAMIFRDEWENQGGE